MTNKSEGKPSDRRAGKGKDRDQRMGQRVPELGYYLTVTSTEGTGKDHLEGLRNNIPVELKDRLTIKVEKAKMVELIKRVLKLVGKESQYRIPWIVFDRDQMKGFDEIIWTVEKNGVCIERSNPYSKIWVYTHSEEMSAIEGPYTCYDRFADRFEKVIRQKYCKNDRDIYRKPIQYGDFEQAVVLAERDLEKCVEDRKKLPSGMRPTCMMQRLTVEILEKIS